MSKEKASELNTRFQELSSGKFLQNLSTEFSDKIRFATSLGAEDQVITHMLASGGIPIDIFTLDTGRMFYESYELIDKVQSRYGINIKIVFPDAGDVEKMVNEKGLNLFYHSIENRKQCCGIRKIKPLQKALQGMSAWITGLRREQSPTRTDLQLVEWDAGNQLIKANPLLNWTEDEVWDYIKKHKIPYNTLHDKGFPSIGCQPCTRAVLPGEDIRSGRWWWEDPKTKECGLHKQ